MVQKIDTIIFNLGGTLIDEEVSYRKVIELTVNNFMRQTAVTQVDIQILKSIPGFSNDWDTSFVLINLLRKRIPKSDWKVEAAKSLPIDRKSYLFKRIYDYFQTCYLGSELYKKLEKGRPPFPYDPGMISYTKTLVDPALIKKLKKHYKLMIVSECPKAEIKIVLNNLGLLGSDYFEMKDVIAQKDVTKAKPDPEGLFAACKRAKAKSAIYIGDDMSDVEAARQAFMPCLYVGDQTSDMNTEEEYGAKINKLLQSFI